MKENWCKAILILIHNIIYVLIHYSCWDIKNRKSRTKLLINNNTSARLIIYSVYVCENIASGSIVNVRDPVGRVSREAIEHYPQVVQNHSQNNVMEERQNLGSVCIKLLL